MTGCGARCESLGISTGGDLDAGQRELVLCRHGFCLALRAHHEGEDAGLFPEIRARHPQLQPAIEKLEQDHQMIASLLRDRDRALTQDTGAEQVARQLDGIAAIMESHFRYEERQLLEVLATLHLGAEPSVCSALSELSRCLTCRLRHSQIAQPRFH